ncbi:hypothetical protein SDC9_208809 [bioreactor metagenome]|uniref:Uncharacterized protein n=1 Tax=bioreactor metagenome TaxID=1076179 RepID=A0A645JBI2_9ZZZZ
MFMSFMGVVNLPFSIIYPDLTKKVKSPAPIWTCPFEKLSTNIPRFTDAIISASLLLPLFIYVALILGSGIYLNDSLRPFPVGLVL